MMNQEKNHHHQLLRQNDIFTGTFSISGANIPVTPVARNLGVLWDSRLSIRAHVNQICRASYVHICNISAIRKMLTKEAAEILGHAFISSRVDYCNSCCIGCQLPPSANFSSSRIGYLNYPHNPRPTTHDQRPTTHIICSYFLGIIRLSQAVAVAKCARLNLRCIGTGCRMHNVF